MSQIRKAGALIIKDKKMMIVKPHGKPFFINPGGKYEGGESAETCLKRELKEELGVDLVSCQHYKTYDIAQAAHSGLPLSLELHQVTVEGDAKPAAEIEILAWLSAADFKNKKYNLAPSFELFVPDLISNGLI